MGGERLENVAPTVYAVKSRDREPAPEGETEPLDAREVFDLIRDINDPEHPLTLEQLNVVQEELIDVHTEDPNDIWVDVRFTPTIPHCSMATLIGLAVRIKLERSLHPSIKVIQEILSDKNIVTQILVSITPGTHASETAINRQLADKERVAAAIENPSLRSAVNKCLEAPSY